MKVFNLCTCRAHQPDSSSANGAAVHAVAVNSSLIMPRVKNTL